MSEPSEIAYAALLIGIFEFGLIFVVYFIIKRAMLSAAKAEEVTGIGRSILKKSVSTPKRCAALHGLLFSMVPLSFWALCLVLLPEEAIVIISSTWIVFPVLPIVGIIQGHAAASRQMDSTSIPHDKLRDVLMTLSYEAESGSNVASVHLKQLLERDDELGKRARTLADELGVSEGARDD